MFWEHLLKFETGTFGKNLPGLAGAAALAFCLAAVPVSAGVPGSASESGAAAPSAPASSAAAPSAPASSSAAVISRADYADMPGGPVRTVTLKSGLQAVLQHVPEAKAACVSLTVDAGSKYDTIGSRGRSHFLEHLLFRRTGKFAGGRLSVSLENAGTRRGARTTDQTIAFWEVVPGDNLDLALDIEADRLSGLVFTDNELLGERRLLVQELESLGRNPLRAVLRRVMHNVWPYTDRGDLEPDGLRSDIRNISAAELRDFYKSRFLPKNACLAVISPEPFDVMEQKIVKRFEAVSGAAGGSASSAAQTGDKSASGGAVRAGAGSASSGGSGNAVRGVSGGAGLAKNGIMASGNGAASANAAAGAVPAGRKGTAAGNNGAAVSAADAQAGLSAGSDNDDPAAGTGICIWGWPAPPLGSSDRAVWMVLDSMWTDGAASYLHSALKEHDLDHKVRILRDHSVGDSLYTVGIQCDPGINPAFASAVINRSIFAQNIAQISTDRLTSAKGRALAGFYRLWQDYPERAFLLSDAVSHKQLGSLASVHDNIDAVTDGEVLSLWRRLAAKSPKTYMSSEAERFSTYKDIPGPREVFAGGGAAPAGAGAVSGAAPAGAEAVSGAAPAGAEAVSGAAPAGAEAVPDAGPAGAEAVSGAAPASYAPVSSSDTPAFFTLASGMRVSVWPVRSLPVVVMRGFLAGSSSAGFAENPGLSLTAARLWGKSTAFHSSDEFIEALEQEGIILRFSVRPEGTYVRAWCRRESLPVLLRLFSESITSPEPSADDAASAIKRQQAENDALSHSDWNKVSGLFAEKLTGIPASSGNASFGAERTQYTAEDLSACLKLMLQPQNLTLSFAGDIDAAALKELCRGSRLLQESSPDGVTGAADGSTDAAGVLQNALSAVNTASDADAASSSRASQAEASAISDAAKTENSAGSNAAVQNKTSAVPAAPSAAVQSVAEKAAIYEVPGTGRLCTIFAGRPGPGPKDADYPAQCILLQILGGSSTSRLALRINHLEKLGQRAEAVGVPMPGRSYWAAVMQVKAEAADRALSILKQELIRLSGPGPSPEELKRAISACRGRSQVEWSSLDAQAEWMLTRHVNGQDKIMPDEFLDSLSRVSADDIRRAAKKWCSSDKLIVVRTAVPKAKGGQKQAKQGKK